MTSKNSFDTTVVVASTGGSTAAGSYNVDNQPPANASDTGWINDDDQDISVTAAPATLPESGPGGFTFTLTRTVDSTGIPLGIGGTFGIADNPLEFPVTVNFSLAGTATCTGNVDYAVSGPTVTYDNTLCTGTVTFDAGILVPGLPATSVTRTVTVTPTNDAAPENNETVIFQITNPTAPNVYGVGSPNNNYVAPPPANSTATVTITNDDFQVFVTVDATSRVEGSTPPAGDEGGIFTYTFTRVLTSRPPLVVREPLVTLHPSAE